MKEGPVYKKACIPEKVKHLSSGLRHKKNKYQAAEVFKLKKETQYEGIGYWEMFDNSPEFQALFYKIIHM